jgi:hypothetical protein
MTLAEVYGIPAWKILQSMEKAGDLYTMAKIGKPKRRIRIEPLPEPAREPREPSRRREEPSEPREPARREKLPAR